MPQSGLAIISSPRDSKSSDAVIRRWIVALAELCAKELTEPLVNLWCRLLADIEVELLERALEETAKTCRFFPTPGEVRTVAARLEYAAETERVLKISEQERQVTEQSRKQFSEAYKQIEAEYLKRGIAKG